MDSILDIIEELEKMSAEDLKKYIKELENLVDRIKIVEDQKGVVDNA